MTRNEAILRGLVRYWPDKPCRSGHTSERYTTTGNCIACVHASRSRISQYRNGRDQGWTSVETQVPDDQVGLLRGVVHLLRLHGGETLRAALADHVTDLVQKANQPVPECLELRRPTRSTRPPVAPYQPSASEEETGVPDKVTCRRSKNSPADVLAAIPAAFRGVAE